MSEDLAQLCCLIIEDLYGTFLAQIFRHLAQQGRLSSNQLAQRCRLPVRQIKSGLGALIQLRLIHHHTAADGASTYQANALNAYNLVRVGKLLDLVTKRHGVAAASIMELLSVLGSATMDDLETRCARILQADHDPSSLRTNGVGEADRRQNSPHLTPSQVRSAIRRLAEDKFIIQVREAHFQSLFDARTDAELHMKGTELPSATKGKKAQEYFDERVYIELEKRLDPSISTASIVLPDDTSASTIPKVETLFCVSYSNVITSIRHDIIARHTAGLLGRPFAQLAKAVSVQVGLETDPFDPRPRYDHESGLQKLDISRLHDDLHSEDLDIENRNGLENGWHHESPLINGQANGQAVGGGVFHDTAIHNHLAVLAEGPFTFLTQDVISRSWLLDRSKMNLFIRNLELMRLIGERLPPPALRIVRMLMDKGKLDEKCLQEIGLLGAKELRQSLAQLQTMGFLELQEVPREPQRQPNRTIFLWFYDAERVRKVLLGELCKAMSRLFQRLHLERERLGSTLSKIERSDVQGSEEEILSPAELRVLQEWRKKEGWFAAEISRLDDSVAILRDL